MIQKSGVTLDRKRLEYVSPTATIKPLGDRLFVKPLPALTSSVLSVVHQSKALRGVVTAVGPGYREKKRRYNSKRECISVSETGRVTPTEVKVGDVVELGSLPGYEGYNFPRVMVGNDEMVICQERDVAMVLDR